LEDFEAAIDNYRTADKLDPTLNSKEAIEPIIERVKQIYHAIVNKV